MTKTSNKGRGQDIHPRKMLLPARHRWDTLVGLAQKMLAIDDKKAPKGWLTIPNLDHAKCLRRLVWLSAVMKCPSLLEFMTLLKIPGDCRVGRLMQTPTFTKFYAANKHDPDACVRFQASTKPTPTPKEPVQTKFVQLEFGFDTAQAVQPAVADAEYKPKRKYTKRVKVAEEKSPKPDNLLTAMYTLSQAIVDKDLSDAKLGSLVRWLCSRSINTNA